MKVSLALLVLSVCAFAAEPDPAPAVAAAETFIKLVDAKQYDKSYEACADVVKKTVTSEIWAEGIDKAHQPLGAFKRRSLALKKFLRDPPSAPSGDYYIIQFDSDFENRFGVTETVSLFHESGKTWRVAGYFLK